MSTKRPSRRELRLVREAQDLAASVATDGPFEQNVTPDEIDTQVIETSEITTDTQDDPIRAARPVIRRRNGTPHSKWMAVVASTATAFLAAGAAGVFMASGINIASAAHGSPTAGTTSVNATEYDAPDSLKRTDGAADSARYYGLERELTGTQPQCEVRSGANSLVSAFVTDEQYVVYPMAEGTYHSSSSFGRRYDPFTSRLSLHAGEDFAANVGTPIYAIADGTVIHTGEGVNGRSSNLIVIAHEINGVQYTSWYIHMYDDGVHVSEGDKVKAGQHIADVGANGRATGPHLHFEIHGGNDLTDNEILDPLDMLTEFGAIEVSDLCS